jgi:Co/Zn/Cd efflux system component
LNEGPVRKAVGLVALMNLAYFGIEFAVAVAIGSVSLFADSVDFLEDASVNFLIFAALTWTARKRARLGMALAAILLVPGIATLWMAWEKFNVPVAPDPLPLSLAGAGALVVADRRAGSNRVRMRTPIRRGPYEMRPRN